MSTAFDRAWTVAVAAGSAAIIAQTVAKGKDSVTIPGWIKFERVTRDPRTVRNPQTGEEITISARRVLTFKPSQVLKSALNGE